MSRGLYHQIHVPRQLPNTPQNHRTSGVGVRSRCLGKLRPNDGPNKQKGNDLPTLETQLQVTVHLTDP